MENKNKVELKSLFTEEQIKNVQQFSYHMNSALKAFDKLKETMESKFVKEQLKDDD